MKAVDAICAFLDRQDGNEHDGISDAEARELRDDEHCGAEVESVTEEGQKQPEREEAEMEKVRAGAIFVRT